jgi:hypothetical protein
MKKWFLILIITIGLMASCTERIDVELDDTFTRLVVYGILTTDTTTHIVELSETTSYYYSQEPPAVTNAIVEISDDLGLNVRLEEVSPGRYATPGDFCAVVGRTYTLRVSLEEEINGSREFTATSKVPGINAVDSVALRYQPDWGEDGFYEVQCWYQDPPERNYYMFNIFKNGRLVTDTISDRFVTDDLFYNGSYTNGIGVGFLNQTYEDERVYPGDTITFQGCSLPEEYYEFVFTLQQQTGFQTPLFSGPPANIASNISNGALGFFAAYSVSYGTTVFVPIK